jgi:hypothetical protein
MLKGTPQLRKHPACIVQLTKQRFYFLPNCLIVGILLNIEYNFFHHIASGAGTLGQSFQNLTRIC